MKTALKVAAGLSAISALTGLASVAHAQNSATATATGSATIIQPISITKTADLGFGTIVKPTDTTATVTVIAGTNTRTITGGSNAVFTNNSTGVGSASFMIAGEGHSAISVTVPSSFVMSGAGTSLTVTTASTAVTGNLSGTIGSPGSFIVGVGGSFPLQTNTPSGAYSGNLIVSVAYN